MAGLNLAVTLEGKTFEVKLLPGNQDGGWQLEPAEECGTSETTLVSLQHVHGDRYQVTLGNRTSQVFIERFNGRYRVVVGAQEFTAHVEDARLHHLREEVAALGGGSGSAEIRAPMPGLVVEVEVVEGERVGEGAGIAIIESMKMENEIRATGPGMVEKVLVEAGQAVDKGQLIAVVAPDGGTGTA